MEPYIGDTAVIAKVGTTPEDRGLETEDFKAKFDEGLTAFVEWFNTTHETEFEALTTTVNGKEAKPYRINWTSVAIPLDGAYVVFILHDMSQYSIEFITKDSDRVKVAGAGLTGVTYDKATRTYSWTYVINVLAIKMA